MGCKEKKGDRWKGGAIALVLKVPRKFTMEKSVEEKELGRRTLHL